MGELKESAQQFHCHTHSRAHQYNHLQTLMTREEAKLEDITGQKTQQELRRRGAGDGGGGQTTKTQTKKTFRCFFYFLPCLVLVWSALVRSSLFLTHTHTHIHTCICVCFLSVSLCENRKEKKKLLNPWMIWDAHMNLSSLSLHKYVSRGIYTFYWRTNQLYYLHNFDKYLINIYNFITVFYILCIHLFIFIQVNVAVSHRSITMQTFTNDYRLLESIIHCTVYTYIYHYCSLFS